jgi:hypothetical protein
MKYIPPAWKHVLVLSILQPGKDTTLSFSHEPKSLLDTVGKLFEVNLLHEVLCELNNFGLLRDEQLRFRPRQSTTMQLTCLFVDDMQQTGVVFLDVAGI